MSDKKRYTMTIDMRRCVGCNACVLACKAENDLPGSGFRNWIVTETRGTFPNLSQEIRSERCIQCDHPACVANCPTGASYVGEGGVVMIARDKCTGCKACIASCSVGARYVHPEGFVDKCNMCMHRVQRGQLPACVEICPTRAITFGDASDPDSDVSRLLRARRAKPLEAEDGLGGHVHFLT
jgi:Fe-S-cluster-containing dehydrogenase component